MATIDFDTTAYDAPVRSSFDPLPPGDYAIIITSSEAKDTKAGTGQYIELTLQVTEGEYAGRRIWERLNIHNQSKQAEDIARAQLNGIAQACGVEPLRETEQLHDIPLILCLDLDRRDPTRNKIMGYKSAGAASKAKPAAKAAAAPAKRAWER
jgi:hypothetical protein